MREGIGRFARSIRSCERIFSGVGRRERQSSRPLFHGKFVYPSRDVIAGNVGHTTGGREYRRSRGGQLLRLGDETVSSE